VTRKPRRRDYPSDNRAAQRDRTNQLRDARVAAGQCETCGDPRNEEGTARQCRGCADYCNDLRNVRKATRRATRVTP
jgi:hypothetical protein